MIKVKNLSKVYKLYQQPQDRLKEALHPFRKKYHHDFYALKNINFEIKKGETIGIIGQNGSGKSTLLKILTSVLTPTDGTYEINGKVSSLLELGTGFNPELSGLENVYFYGSILGFTRAEIDAKIDDILSFADIGEFIYQTVKTYSSGMYVRLAFAVAIQVDPDILIVDEALSVGDIKFQLKCFRKFSEFQAAGKTILFVTHDTGAVINYCSRAIWLNDGIIKEVGNPESVCKHYMSFMAYGEETKKLVETQNFASKNTETNCNLSASQDKSDENISWQSVVGSESFGVGGAKITHVAFYDVKTKKSLNILQGGEEVCLAMKITSMQKIEKPIFGFYFSDPYGNNIFGTNNFLQQKHIPSILKEKNMLVNFLYKFPKIHNDRYSLTIAIAEGTQENHIQHHWIHDALVVEVLGSDLESRFGARLILENVKINFD